MNLDYRTQVQHKGAAELVKVQQKMQVIVQCWNRLKPALCEMHQSRRTLLATTEAPSDA